MAILGDGIEEATPPLEAVEVEDGSDPSDNSVETNRPPLRKIDKRIQPRLPFLTRRATVVLLSFIGFIILSGVKSYTTIITYDIEPVRGRLDDLNSKVHYAVAAGYLITGIPAGLLATLYPASTLFGTAIALSSVLNFCISLAYVNPYIFVAIKFLQSLAEGVTYPAFIVIMSHWSPPPERTRMVALTFSGTYIGLFISVSAVNLVEGIGGSYISYVLGSIGILWCLLWFWLVFEKPAYHTCIETTELKFIESSLGMDQKRYVAPALKNVPWKAIFTSPPVYAIIVASYCRSCSFNLMREFEWKYLLDIYDTAFSYVQLYQTLLQLIFMILAMLIGGILADWLRKRKTQNTTQVRKLIICGGSGLEIIFVILMAFTNSFDLTLKALSIGMIFGAFALSGIDVNFLDIASGYAGILMGLSNTIGATIPFFSHYVTNKLKGQYEYFNFTFILLAVIYFIGVIFYGIFASGEQQPWAKPKRKEDYEGTKLKELSSELSVNAV